MSTDRELLELAAKAIGIHIAQGSQMAIDGKIWNPLADDGDALQLQAKLQINIKYDEEYVTASKTNGAMAREYYFERSKDEAAATRYALTRVAAEIGKHSAPSKEES